MWGLRYVAKILRKEGEKYGRWPLCVQISSIGSLGQKPDLWFQGEFSHSFKGHDTVLEKPVVVSLIIIRSIVIFSPSLRFCKKP
jgi:hypothetical protein